MRSSRVLALSASVVAALTISVASADAQTACAGADTAVTSSNATAARAALTCLLNNERTARGIPALNPNPALAQAAQAHADDMAARGYKDVDAPDPAPQGKTPRDRATTFGYPAGNQVYGVWLSSGVTPRSNALVVMSQAALCSTLIDPAYTDIGVGAAPAPDGLRFSVSFGGQGVPLQSNPDCPVGKLVTPASQPVLTPKQAAQALAKQPPSAIAGKLGFPATKACQSRRAFTIRIRESKAIRLRGASLYLAGRRSVAVRRTGRLRALVDLRGFAKGTFELRIVATTTTGVKLTGVRKYKTCAGRANL